MKAALLIIMLAHGGYWFGGENDITVKWTAPEAGTPAAVLAWKVTYGELQVAAGEAEVVGGDKQSTVKLQVPDVRVLTSFEWSYELRENKTGKVLERGSREIRLVPPKTLERVAGRMKGRKILVLEQEKEGITGLLQAAGVEALRVASLGDLQLTEADIILVGQDHLPENPAVQEVLLTKARKGAGVMVFAQQHATCVGDWEIRSRKIQPAFTWRLPHALFDSFSASALDSWAKEKDAEVKVLALPAHAGVLELGYFPRETPGNTPVPIDVLAATQTIGDGRLVFWQIRVGSWKHDPRGQLLLANALDYLLTRPEPTLPQSQRQPEARKSPSGKQLIGVEP